jgi:hypothetical protein
MEDGRLGPYLRVAAATPAVASGRLEVVTRPAAFDRPPFWDFQFEAGDPDTAAAKTAVRDLYRTMAPEPARRKTGVVLMSSLPRGAEWQGSDPVAPAIETAVYEVTPNTVHLVVDADKPGFLRLAHPYSPTSTVTRNGQVIEAAPDVMSMIVLPLQPGRNDIRVVSSPSTLRVACFAATALVVVALMLVLVVAPLRDRRA